MQQRMNDKKAKVRQKRNSPSDVQIRPKTEELSSGQTHNDNPLANITCKIGDNACAAKHVSVIQRTGLFHPMNESQKVQSLLRLQQQYGNRFVQRVIAQHANQFTPRTIRGRRLLAHELAHTIQQGDGKSDLLSRVPDESGIRETPPRYNFSTNCGWIDWSHADPGIGADLISRVRQASDALRAAGTSATSSTGEFTSTTMASRAPVVGVVLSSASLRVRLLRPLSGDEVLSVALSIFKKLSVVFETQQQWTQLVGRSSFSQEDLPSNLIGFYMAARGYTRDQINQYCGSLDANGSLQEYNRDHDFETNRSFLPVGITGHWPPELLNINDSQAPALYEILTMSATQGTTSFRFCPIYRVEGLIGETDLFIVSFGGKQFTAADNLRVVPTYMAREGTSGSYGHVTFIEVEPYGQADFHTFRQHNISWPIYVPEPVLVCLSSHGNPV